MAKSLDPKTLDAYAGKYEIEQLRDHAERVADRGWAVPYSSQVKHQQELLPLSETRFFVVIGIDIYDVEFTLDETNQVTGLVVTVYGQSFTARRK